ncbi:MAG: Asp-tRNA(Asn)/Glu-tRNA(Gln) amidotransferase subunit GatC [Bdellovibrionales bacterium]|nr:Asp-tRNA(Asn)/Glu-tRNA(Gln) amidotransferase subunit GatC [Bdellovibrionales bacterium]
MSREWLEKTSTLARLRLNEEELQELIPQLGQILDHVDQLRSVSTEGVEPYIHPLAEISPEAASVALRADTLRSVEEQIHQATRVLGVAPELTESSFQVPQAVAQAEGRSK